VTVFPKAAVTVLTKLYIFLSVPAAFGKPLKSGQYWYQLPETLKWLYYCSLWVKCSSNLHVFHRSSWIFLYITHKVLFLVRLSLTEPHCTSISVWKLPPMEMTFLPSRNAHIPYLPHSRYFCHYFCTFWHLKKKKKFNLKFSFFLLLRLFFLFSPFSHSLFHLNFLNPQSKKITPVFSSPLRGQG
jgi:hypothetical protein